MVCRLIPLKNVGFQMKKGATPHLVNNENRNIDQTKPMVKSSLYVEDVAV